MYDKKHREWAIQDLATQYRILDKLIKDKEDEIDLAERLLEIDDYIASIKNHKIGPRIELMILVQYHLEVIGLMDSGYYD